MKHRFISILSCYVLLGAPVYAQTEVPKIMPLWPNVAPLAKGNSEHDQPHLISWPAAAENNCGAAVVICPGGGYGALAMDHEGAQVARWFNSHGISAFILRYRLGIKGYHYPTQLIDVQRAIRWVRHHAKDHQIDPQRIGIMGFSAGGHLTSMAATMFDVKPEGMTNDEIDQHSARPDFAILAYPVISLIDSFAHKGSRKYLLGPNDAEEQAKALSTQHRVTEKTPPVFLFHTNDDLGVPAENSIAFYLAARQHRVPAEIHIYEPGRHGLGLALNDPMLAAWSEHLHRWLKYRGFLAPKAQQ
jgi:acetyl esterase/lipase